MKQILITYIPVIHRGYLDLLEKYNKKINTLYILGEDITSEISEYKEIRAVDPCKLKKLIDGMNFSFTTKILTLKNIKTINANKIISTSDFISKKFIKKNFPDSEFFFETAFLRWDEDVVKSSHLPSHNSVTKDIFDQRMMKKAIEIGKNSSDWWRRVGAVVVKDRKIIMKSHNEYLPSDYDPYVNGNPRDFIKSGTLGFLATSVHAEQSAIAKASKLKKSLKGSDMYISTYPCPTCAKLMAISGIKRCFFMGGNAYLNVEEVFKSAKMKTILVKLN